MDTLMVWRSFHYNYFMTFRIVPHVMSNIISTIKINLGIKLRYKAYFLTI